MTPVRAAPRPADHVVRFTNAPVAPLLEAAAIVDRLRAAVRTGTSKSVRIGGVRFRPPPPGGTERVIHLRTVIWNEIVMPMMLRSRHPSRRWDAFALELVINQDPATIATPSILIGFHTEPVAGFLLLAATLPIPLTIVMANPMYVRVAATLADTVAVAQVTIGDVPGRTAAFLTAVRTLRRGGSVLLLVDGYSDSQLRTTVLGRPFPLSAGACALSRLSGAPLVPLATHWQGSRPYLAVGEPVPAGDADEMAAALGTWLERYLREHPSELTPFHAQSLGVSPSRRQRWMRAILNTVQGTATVLRQPAGLRSRIRTAWLHIRRRRE